MGTSNVNTETVNSSAKILPNKRKLNDKGFVKSSNTLIGNNTGVGCKYFKKISKTFFLKTSIKICN